MTPRSEAATEALYPPFSVLLHKAAAMLEPEIYICIIEGWRSPIEQDIDYDKGRNPQGQIVDRRQVITNAKAGQSWHQYGLAVDVVPYLQGDSGALNWRVDSPQFAAMVKAMKDVGLQWGGNWNFALQDNDHFQMAGLPPSPPQAIRNAYESARVNHDPANPNLAPIWAVLFPPDAQTS